MVRASKWPSARGRIATAFALLLLNGCVANGTLRNSDRLPSDADIHIGARFEGAGYLLASHQGLQLLESVDDAERLAKARQVRCLNLTVSNVEKLQELRALHGDVVRVTGSFGGYSPELIDTGRCGTKYVLIVDSVSKSSN